MSADYPREWFEAARWIDEPNAKMIEKETATRLYFRERGQLRFVNRAGRYGCHWFPTREEAQAAIDRRKANTAEHRRMEDIRAAAPELLAALQALFADYKQLADSGDSGNWSLEDTPAGKQALAALAKALPVTSREMDR